MHCATNVESESIYCSYGCRNVTNGNDTFGLDSSGCQCATPDCSDNGYCTQIGVCACDTGYFSHDCSYRVDEVVIPLLFGTSIILLFVTIAFVIVALYRRRTEFEKKIKGRNEEMELGPAVGDADETPMEEITCDFSSETPNALATWAQMAKRGTESRHSSDTSSISLEE